MFSLIAAHPKQDRCPDVLRASNNLCNQLEQFVYTTPSNVAPHTARKALLKAARLASGNRRLADLAPKGARLPVGHEQANFVYKGSRPSRGQRHAFASRRRGRADFAPIGARSLLSHKRVAIHCPRHAPNCPKTRAPTYCPKARGNVLPNNARPSPQMRALTAAKKRAATECQCCAPT